MEGPRLYQPTLLTLLPMTFTSTDQSGKDKTDKRTGSNFKLHVQSILVNECAKCIFAVFIFFFVFHKKFISDFFIPNGHKSAVVRGSFR